MDGFHMKPQDLKFKDEIFIENIEKAKKRYPRDSNPEPLD